MRHITDILEDNICENKEITEKQIAKYGLRYNSETGLYDCYRDVHCKKDLVYNGKFKIKFGVINGSFTCSYLDLTTLEGAPKEIDGNFYCGGNLFTDLEGCPNIIKGQIYCNDNTLKSFKGITSNFDKIRGIHINGNGRKNELPDLTDLPTETTINYFYRK